MARKKPLVGISTTPEKFSFTRSKKNKNRWIFTDPLTGKRSEVSTYRRNKILKGATKPITTKDFVRYRDPNKPGARRYIFTDPNTGVQTNISRYMRDKYLREQNRPVEEHAVTPNQLRKFLLRRKGEYERAGQTDSPYYDEIIRLYSALPKPVKKRKWEKPQVLEPGAVDVGGYVAPEIEESREPSEYNRDEAMYERFLNNNDGEDSVINEDNMFYGYSFDELMYEFDRLVPYDEDTDTSYNSELGQLFIALGLRADQPEGWWPIGETPK